MKRKAGFTLIELLVVLAILGMLLTIVAPRYFNSVDKASEAVLKENLYQLRDTLDKFYADQGRYPENLDELVSKRYLRRVPTDPITQSNQTWKLIKATEAQGGGVVDVKSAATGKAKDGTSYASW
jgi:general secretion pathway protein G